MKAIKRSHLAIRVIRGIKALPWWGSALLSVACYLVIRYMVAMIPWYFSPSLPPLLQQANYLLWQATGYIQYVIPGGIALLSMLAWRRDRKGVGLIKRVAMAKHSSPLLQMSWQEFELMVSAYFNRLGYMSKVTGGVADGGIDIVLTRGNEIHLVQCKQWRANRVPVSVVRELYGVIIAHGADGGFLVTSGQFTRDAVEFAAGRNIELVDGQSLLRHIKSQNEHRSEGMNPLCPLCGHAMVQRVSRRGPTIGQSFWGCSQYPTCTGVRT